jgi:hypothetical protein
MTTVLERAFAEAAKLPEPEQVWTKDKLRCLARI